MPGGTVGPSAPAASSNPTGATEVTRFGDWEVSCAAATEKATTTEPGSRGECRATQRLVAKDTGQVVFIATVLPNPSLSNSKAAKPASYVGIISVPLGGYLAPGIELSIDKTKPYKILFETCNLAGCHAGFPIAGPVLKALQKGKTASFKIWTTKAKPAAVAVSLAGLPDALAALTKNVK